MKSCPECNSQKIIEDAKAIDRGDYNATQDMQIAIDEEPNALIFKQRIFSSVKADVCADCGLVQFYAKEPKMLWAAYQNR